MFIADHDSRDSEISHKVSSQLVSSFCDTATSVAASERLSTLNNCEIFGNTDTGKSTDSVGVYMENGSANDVPLEPLKAEKLATFGEYINCIYYLC